MTSSYAVATLPLSALAPIDLPDLDPTGADATLLRIVTLARVAMLGALGRVSRADLRAQADVFDVVSDATGARSWTLCLLGGSCATEETLRPFAARAISERTLSTRSGADCRCLAFDDRKATRAAMTAALTEHGFVLSGKPAPAFHLLNFGDADESWLLAGGNGGSIRPRIEEALDRARSRPETTLGPWELTMGCED